MYSYALGRPSISESSSESTRNSSHSGFRRVRKGASDDSDSSESVQDSDSNEETGLRPFRESFLLHPSLCYISLTVSSGRRMKRITTRVNCRLLPGLSQTLNNFSPLSPLFRHPFYSSIAILAYLASEIIYACSFLLVYSKWKHFWSFAVRLLPWCIFANMLAYRSNRYLKFSLPGPKTSNAVLLCAPTLLQVKRRSSSSV